MLTTGSTERSKTTSSVCFGVVLSDLHVLGCGKTSSFSQSSDWSSHRFIGNFHKAINLSLAKPFHRLTMASKAIWFPVSISILDCNSVKALSDADGSIGSFSFGPKHCGKLVISLSQSDLLTSSAQVDPASNLHPSKPAVLPFYSKPDQDGRQQILAQRGTCRSGK